ncbi:hypothetical protein [Agreia sp. Leaf283]|uniref:hypothetical protein n=1 Tax=Agreia sp. Leaf283 TaxID=1736321 RepID=UPI000B32C411|nr:hypothetical protein [Agreia sp. Leaf283]
MRGIRARSGDARPDDRQRMRPAGADARRRAARAVAGAAVASLAAGALLAFGALPASADSFTVDDAVFAWGISNEANNRAFAPGTYNVMSAGVAPKTSGADTISESEWAATSGDVTIQKKSADGTYATATWAGLTTTPTGEPIPSPTSGRFSDHRVAISNGGGTLDAASDDADIAWSGSFTVAFYNGMTQFSVSDPHLSVTAGVGTVTATLSGYGTSMDDPDVFEQLPTSEVTIATLTGVDVTESGLIATPDYDGVEVELPESASPQVRSGSAWGSFPQSYVDYQLLTGQSSYWYSSGLSTDGFKRPLPIEVSFDSVAPVVTAPSVETQPVDARTSARLGTSFAIEARGSAPLTYQWERSDDEGATWTAVGDGAATLSLASVALSDSGALFRATASNPAGSAVSDVARLTVDPYVLGSVAPAFDGVAAIRAAVKAGHATDETSSATGVPASIASNQTLELGLPWAGASRTGEVWLSPGAVYLGSFTVAGGIASAEVTLPALGPGDYSLLFVGDDGSSKPATVFFSVTPDQQGLHDVSYATFRWGVNNESNNSAFAPGTVNFFSAGKVADTGGHGTTLPESSWKQSEGNVAIEKQQADGSFAPATWAGLKTSPSGAPLGSPTTKTFSNHQVVLSQGVGRVDPGSDNADIQWDGDFTVAYYSGMTFFYVSDPRLLVANGVGTLTATLGGYGTDMDDMSKWVPLSDTAVTLATLPSVDVTAAGFVVTPAYDGVRVSIPASGVAQKTDEAGWGSFPQDFVDFQALTGQAAYWYSSGGSVDANKTALPMTVCFDSPECSPPASAIQPESTAASVAQTALTAPRALRAPSLPPVAEAVPASMAQAAGSSQVVVVQQEAGSTSDPGPLILLLVILLAAAGVLLVVTVPTGGLIASGHLLRS